MHTKLGQGLEWAILGLSSALLAQFLMVAYNRPHTPVGVVATDKYTVCVGIGGAVGAAAAFAVKSYLERK